MSSEASNPSPASDHHAVLHKAGSRLLFWMALLVLLTCNALLALALLPMMLVLSAVQVYLAAGGLGVAFGLFYELLLRDREHLSVGHHIAGGVLMPIAALLNFLIISWVTTLMPPTLQAAMAVKPFALGLTYTVCFILPYLLGGAFRKA